MNRHGLRVEHICEQCQTSFKTGRDLIDHRLEAHQGRRRIPCEVEGCWFQSYLPKYYRRHMREGRHGEKPRRSMNAVTIEAMKATGAR